MITAVPHARSGDGQPSAPAAAGPGGLGQIAYAVREPAILSPLLIAAAALTRRYPRSRAVQV